MFVVTPSRRKDRGGIYDPAAIFYFFKYGPYAPIVRRADVDLYFRGPFALSLDIYHGLKYKFTSIIFFELVCYLMAKKRVETRRMSELVDGVEPLTVKKSLI